MLLDVKGKKNLIRNEIDFECENCKWFWETKEKNNSLYIIITINYFSFSCTNIYIPIITKNVVYILWRWI